MRHASLAVLILLISLGSGAAAVPVLCDRLHATWSFCARSSGTDGESLCAARNEQYRSSEGRYPSISRNTWLQHKLDHSQRPWARYPLTRLIKWPITPIRALLRVRMTVQASGANGTQSWTAVQIATPIAVGVVVAALAMTFFLWYRRRDVIHHTSQRTQRQTGNSTSYSPWTRARLNAPRLFFGFLPGVQTVHSRSLREDPSWEIDDIPWHDAQPSLSSAGSSAALEPGGGTPDFHPLIEDDDDNDDGYFPQRPAHSRDKSSTALLPGTPPRLEAPVPTVQPAKTPSMFGRLFRFKDGLRKSPSYRSGHVHPKVPDTRFKIDATDSPANASTFKDPHIPCSHTTPPRPDSNTLAGLPSSSVASISRQRPAPETSPNELDECSVLLISRRPGEDFALESTYSHE